MNAMRRMLAPVALAGALAGYGTAAGAQQPHSCALPGPTSDSFHAWAAAAPYNQPLRVLDTESAVGRLAVTPKTLTLRDVPLVHGHLCDGLVIAWVELGAALRQLFPDGVVDRTDVRVVSKNGPCWVHAAGWTTGARVNHGTLILDNSVGDGFIVQRVSTRETVRVRLRPGLYPRWLAELEQSIRAQQARNLDVDPGDIDRFEAGATGFSRHLLATPPGEVVELIPLVASTFPAANRNPLAPRSDVINRSQRRR